MKKILIVFLLLSTSIYSQSPALIGSSAPVTYTGITFTTLSSSPVWSPEKVTNTGNVLKWELTGDDIGILTQTINDPTFDLSVNTKPINGEIKSTDHFAGLTELRFNNNNLTDINILQANKLTDFACYSNPGLTSIDLSTLTALTHLKLNNNAITVIDISHNVNLQQLHIYENSLTVLDVSNNKELIDVDVHNNNMTSGALDNLVQTLDANGKSNGTLVISGNNGAMTSASYQSYMNLIAKNWSIDMENLNDNLAPAKMIINSVTEVDTPRYY